MVVVSDIVPRRRDETWDALMAVCAVTEPIPRSARGAYNRMVAELKEIGATPHDITLRAIVYRLRWPGISLTPTALVRRWSECDPSELEAHLAGEVNPSQRALTLHRLRERTGIDAPTLLGPFVTVFDERREVER